MKEEIQQIKEGLAYWRKLKDEGYIMSHGSVPVFSPEEALIRLLNVLEQHDTK